MEQRYLNQLIKKKILDNDERTLYLLAWGGTNTISRALKDIEKENKPKPEDSKYKDGVSFEVGVAPHNEDVRLLESKYDALKNATNAAYTTHKEYEVVPVNGGYKSQPKSGQ